MSKSIEPHTYRFRGSALAVRIGTAILALAILAYSLVISASRLHDASSGRDYLALGSLWLLAIGALLLLVRAWRSTTRKAEEAPESKARS